LFEALEMRRRITEKIAEKGGTPFDGSVMLVADENTPYELMASVVQVAGKAGFNSYRMIVRLKK
jgi:biopolymer transport protein ExbD